MNNKHISMVWFLFGLVNIYRCFIGHARAEEAFFSFLVSTLYAKLNKHGIKE